MLERDRGHWVALVRERQTPSHAGRMAWLEGGKGGGIESRGGNMRAIVPRGWLAALERKPPISLSFAYFFPSFESVRHFLFPIPYFVR